MSTIEKLTDEEERALVAEIEEVGQGFIDYLGSLQAEPDNKAVAHAALAVASQAVNRHILGHGGGRSDLEATVRHLSNWWRDVTIEMFEQRPNAVIVRADH